MTATQFKKLLKELGFTQLHTADLLKRDARTVRRWCLGGKKGTKVPADVALALKLLQNGHLTEQLIRDAHK